jgi:cytidylate kinase
MAVVTISRQVGSLGDEVARVLAEDLGYHLVTSQDIQDVARSYDESFAADVSGLEMERGPSFLERLFFAQPVYTSLYGAVILELASRRQVVILGRGSQVVLRHVPQVLRVRVVAPIQLRAQRVGQALSLGPDEAMDYVDRYDQERRALVRQIFDHDLRDWGLYHLVLNTEALDAAGAGSILKKAVSELVRLHPMEDVSRLLGRMALAKRIEAKLRRLVLRANSIKADAAPDGSVVLSGYLYSEPERQRAQELAVEMAGSIQVANDVRVSSFQGLWPM